MSEEHELSIYHHNIRQSGKAFHAAVNYELGENRLCS